MIIFIYNTTITPKKGLIILAHTKQVLQCLVTFRLLA